MECLYCKGTMIKSTAPFSADRNGYHISWDSVPAWVCTQCGEPLFEAKEKRSYRSVKISEEEIAKTPKKEQALKKEISRLSFTMASKLPFAKGEQRADISAALSLMTQAMILADDEILNPEARRHLALARRLAR